MFKVNKGGYYKSGLISKYVLRCLKWLAFYFDQQGVKNYVATSILLSTSNFVLMHTIIHFCCLCLPQYGEAKQWKCQLQ